MASLIGTMATARPGRYAKQLVGHWAARGPVTDEGGATVQRWDTGQLLVLRPLDGVLEIEVAVPDGDDVRAFAEVVKVHLERFGQREELNVVWRE